MAFEMIIFALMFLKSFSYRGERAAPLRPPPSPHCLRSCPGQLPWSISLKIVDVTVLTLFVLSRPVPEFSYESAQKKSFCTNLLDVLSVRGMLGSQALFVFQCFLLVSITKYTLCVCLSCS